MKTTLAIGDIDVSKMSMKMALQIAHNAHWIIETTPSEKIAAAKILRKSARRNPDSVHSPIYVRYATSLEQEDAR
jgi:hypothetical protein